MKCWYEHHQEPLTKALNVCVCVRHISVVSEQKAMQHLSALASPGEFAVDVTFSLVTTCHHDQFSRSDQSSLFVETMTQCYSHFRSSLIFKRNHLPAQHASVNTSATEMSHCVSLSPEFPGCAGLCNVSAQPAVRVCWRKE